MAYLFCISRDHICILHIQYVCYVAEADGMSYFIFVKVTLSALEILQKLFQNQHLYWRF